MNKFIITQIKMNENIVKSIKISTLLNGVPIEQPLIKTQKVINYTQLQTLKSNKPNKLLPGLHPSSKSFITKRTSKTSQKTNWLTQEPKLLTTAVDMIKRKYQQLENIQNDNQSIGLSVFNSRQITPIHPLGGASFHNNSIISKKRVKTHQTIKSRLHSINSDLREMDSHDQSLIHILPAHKQKDFKLHDVLLGQSDTVYHYAFGKQRKIPSKLIYQWKQCLFHQDKAEIFVPINPEDSRNVSYTNPRFFPLNELEKGFDQLYGVGKQRCLKAGQQALIVEGIQKYLQKCDQQPMKIARKDYDIISEILVDCKLQQLENYQMCYKQIEGHLKIMATRWRYRHIDNKANRIFESAIISGKNNFIDLGKSSVLSDYLLKHSNRNEQI